MSCFLRAGTAQNGIQPGVLLASDERSLPNYARRSRTEVQPFADGMLWPNSRSLGGGLSMLLGDDASNSSGNFEAWPEASGTSTRAKISGTTRDSSSNPLGNCTIQVLSADGTIKAYSTTSDGSGAYEALIEDPTLSYKVDAYLAGSPDVAGTTINTLVAV
jgi:hypothetical protein